MSKVVVYIEETLCKEIEIDVPNELGLDADEEMEYAENKAKEMYKNKEIVLTAEDYTGITGMMVKHEDGTETSWNEI